MERRRGVVEVAQALQVPDHLPMARRWPKSVGQRSWGIARARARSCGGAENARLGGGCGGSRHCGAARLAASAARPGSGLVVETVNIADALMVGAQCGDR